MSNKSTLNQNDERDHAEAQVEHDWTHPPVLLEMLPEGLIEDQD